MIKEYNQYPYGKDFESKIYNCQKEYISSELTQ